MSASARRDVVETSSFDAKAALPPAGKNKDLGKDVCAMTADGGVLLYGVGGDDRTRPDTPTPFDLKGAAERIDQVVQTGISEPPFIEIRDVHSEREPGKGYLVVVVPASARAPHMLTLGGDNRYWGRGASGNRLLTEGEVARLYARRERWQFDVDSLLNEASAGMPFDYSVPIEQIGPITVVASPVTGIPGLLSRATGGAPVREFFTAEMMQKALAVDPFPNQGSRGMGGAYAPSPRGADVWLFSDGRDPAGIYQATVELRANGRLTYWNSPTINSRARDGESAPVIMEQSVTRAVHQVVRVAAWLYEKGGYFGSVDLGVVLKGIEPASAASRLREWSESGPRYGAPEFRRAERISITEMRGDPRAVTTRLVRPLYEAISVRDYQPFGEARDGT
ncbi:MAG TPA: RNA-binding domain-containing protein [Conexibacter sp.]